MAAVNLQNQVASMVTDPEEEARQALREQHGVLAFCRRLAVLHCSKLVALAAFAAAMQGQDAMGWLFVGEIPGFPNPLELRSSEVEVIR